MIVFLFILVAVMFVGIKVTPQGEFHTDYAAPKQTATINAIFTILIFLSHSTQYLSVGGALDDPYLSARKYIGQLVVASFLFYSGFGMMQSIEKKGIDYVKGIPSKRLFKVWYHFAIAVVMFIALNLLIGNTNAVKENGLLAFTGYKAVGNSNWYMFITFVMYIIIYIAFMIIRKPKLLAVVLTFALTFGFVLLEMKLDLGERYYNTIFCLPAGMLFSLIKPYFDRIVMKNDIFWSVSFAIVFAFYYVFSANRDDNIYIHNLFAIFAVILIMMFNMKVKIGNTMLDFFGAHIFSFFILQRLPMILLKSIGYTDHKYNFIIISFICTICLSLIFDWFTGKTDSLIYRKKAK